MAKGNRPLKLSDIQKPPLEEGENPFVEEAEVLEDDQQDLGPGVTYHVPQYEQTQRPRGNWIFFFGIVSVVAVIGSLLLREFERPFMGIFPWPEGWTVVQTLLVILVVLPAAIWGNLELRAIRYGATPTTQAGSAKAGTIMAWLAFVAYLVELAVRWSVYLLDGVFF